MKRLCFENPPHDMPKEYYVALRKFNDSRDKLNTIARDPRVAPVASEMVGECAEYKREIVTTTYERAQRRLTKEVEIFMGVR